MYELLAALLLTREPPLRCLLPFVDPLMCMSVKLLNAVVLENIPLEILVMLF